jgi:hypothetical protein
MTSITAQNFSAIDQGLSADLMAKSKHTQEPPPKEVESSPTHNWKPALNRRQSWKHEDKKHDLQMSDMGHSGTVTPRDPGYSSERPQ